MSANRPMALNHKYRDIGRVHRACELLNKKGDTYTYFVIRFIDSTGKIDLEPLNEKKLKTHYYYWRIQREKK